tara:strand:- start:986 stop:1738 length:753 start_codon:yes stop_codon:yes gene_type:complete
MSAIVGIVFLIVTSVGAYAGSGVIRINYYNKFSPLSVKQDGRMQGILVDALDAVIGQRMDRPLEHRGYPWQRAQAQVRSGEADAFCTNPTDARKAFAYFTKKPFVTSYVVILTSHTNPRKDSIDRVEVIEDLRPFRQVDHRGNGWAKKWFKDLDVHWVNSLEQAVKLLDAHRYDIFVGNGLVVRAIVNKLGLKDRIAVREVPDIATPGKFHFGLRKTYPDAQNVIDAVDAALADAKADGDIERIVSRYLE